MCLMSRWWRWILDKDDVLADICSEVEVPGSESTALTESHSVVMKWQFGALRWRQLVMCDGTIVRAVAHSASDLMGVGDRKVARA